MPDKDENEYLDIQNFFKPRNKKRFDRNLPPDGPHKMEAARERGLRYEPNTECFVDPRGRPMRNKFGEPV